MFPLDTVHPCVVLLVRGSMGLWVGNAFALQPSKSSLCTVHQNHPQWLSNPPTTTQQPQNPISMYTAHPHQPLWILDPPANPQQPQRLISMCIGTVPQRLSSLPATLWQQHPIFMHTVHKIHPQQLSNLPATSWQPQHPIYMYTVYHCSARFRMFFFSKCLHVQLLSISLTDCRDKQK